MVGRSSAETSVRRRHIYTVFADLTPKCLPHHVRSPCCCHNILATALRVHCCDLVWNVYWYDINSLLFPLCFFGSADGSHSEFLSSRLYASGSDLSVPYRRFISLIKPLLGAESTEGLSQTFGVSWPQQTRISAKRPNARNHPHASCERCYVFTQSQ